jgi:hypothetical protein
LFLVDCGVPGIENGKIDSSGGTLFGQSVTVVCNEGYNISGADIWTCANTGWDGTTTCIIQGEYAICFKLMFCVVVLIYNKLLRFV